jgi:hypothetical protein
VSEWCARSGFGILHESDGSVYEGFFKHGARAGAGVQRYAAGGRYEGEWAAGSRSGFGTFTVGELRRQRQALVFLFLFDIPADGP